MLLTGLLGFLLVSITIFNINADTNTLRYDEDQPYCFRFTWLGPKYTNSTPKSSFMNQTCNDVNGVPCEPPLVVSENGKEPNTTFMWETYRANVSHIACRLTESEVCVRFTYKFNHALENITYMCSQVHANGAGVRSGCYSQFVNGREIEVCVCESASGRIPCNSAPDWTASSLTTVTAVAVAVWASASYVV